MLLIEFSPPFQWKPSLKKHGDCRRFMWGWLAIARVPYDLNGYIEGIGLAALDITAADPEFSERLRRKVEARR